MLKLYYHNKRALVVVAVYVHIHIYIYIHIHIDTHIPLNTNMYTLAKLPCERS